MQSRMSRSVVGEAYAASTAFGQIAHMIRACAPLLVNPWVVGAGPDLCAVWTETLRLVDREHAQQLYGVISSPGPEQKLAIVDPEAGRVYKTNVHAQGARPLRAELDHLHRLKQAHPSLILPEYEWSDRGRPLLITRRLTGTIPRWNDDRARRAARQSLAVPSPAVNHAIDCCAKCAERLVAITESGRLGSAAVRHGDFVPWNTRVGDAGHAVVFDWEFAEPGELIPMMMNDLEWVLRGAAGGAADLRRGVSKAVTRVAAEYGFDGVGETRCLVQAYICSAWRLKRRFDRADSDIVLARLMKTDFLQVDLLDCESRRELQLAQATLQGSVESDSSIRRSWFTNRSSA
jgi:hypothetical protein